VTVTKRNFTVQRNLKRVAGVFILASVAACEPTAPEPNKPIAPELEKILLYCDANTDKPVTLTSDDDGTEFEATLSYRGFYRIDLKAETLETQFAGNDEFSSLCPTGGSCNLVSNKSKIRFENNGRRWKDKVIDEEYVFERNTGHFYRKSESNGPDGAATEYARGNCKPMNSIDQQLF